MRIDIISLFPEMFAGFLESSIPLRARKKGFLDLQLHNLCAYSNNRYKSVDDYPYGGGAGMVISIEPVDNCISALKAERDYDEVIFTSPDAPVLDQPTANTLSLCRNIIILCGHYKGVDERIREHLVTREISIGDYVLSGGELAAAVITDAVVRLIPGVLNDETSALSDSFQNGLLSPPVYTRPLEYKGWKVPEVLLGGNDRLKEQWRYEQALARTRERRPSLLDDKA